jgi:probable O-glycosylation ligase (exosortase A-associated)
MRDLAFAATLVSLLALAAARPFVGVLVWCWIGFMNPHRECWGFAVSMPWAMLTFLVTVFGCVVAREPKRLSLNAVTVLLAVFGVCITLTSIIGITPAEQRWQMWDRTIKVLAGLLLTSAMLTERRRVDALVWIMVISLGFYGVKGGLFTLVTGGKYKVLGPYLTMVADRNHIAVGLLIALPLMNYLRLQARHRIVGMGLAFAMAMTVFAAIGTQSRSALIALTATVGVFWLRSRGKIVSGMAMGVLVASAIAFMPDTWVERMNTIQTYEQDASAMGRITIWMAALALTQAHPLTGVGFNATYSQGVVNTVTPHITARATHNIWLEVLADHGVPTFLVWLSIFLSGVWYSLRIVREARDRPELGWAYDLARMSQASMVAYAVGGSFLSLSYWDFFWTILVAIGATHGLVARAIREGARAAPLTWRARPAMQAAAAERA